MPGDLPSGDPSALARPDSNLIHAGAIIESDIERAIGDVTVQNGQAVERAQVMARDAGRIGQEMQRVAAAAAARVAALGPATIDLSGIGTLPAHRVGGHARRRHLQFAPIPPDLAARLEDFLDGVVNGDARFIAVVQSGARQIEAALTASLARGEITEARLFDFTYTLIPDSDPEQYLTPPTDLADRLFPAIQEPMLRLDGRVQFARVVDVNGYLPTHNARYSQKQRRGKVAWNAANCRNRRIFNDRAGLASGRCSGPFLRQSYERDMGDGEKLVLKEADVPIALQGRPWGGFRLAYKAR